MSAASVALHGENGVPASNTAEPSWLLTLKRLHKGPDAIPEQQPFFQVPHSLRTGLNADAYQPILFNFGLWRRHSAASPFSFVPDSTSSAFFFKLQAAKKFCDLGAKSPDRFERLVQKLKRSDHDKMARDCYGLRIGEQNSSVDAVAYVLALDTVTVYVAAMKSNEVQFHPPCVRSIVRNDAVLLDNQLPIFAFRCLLQVLADVTEVALIEVYGWRNSPFPKEGLCVKEPDENDLKSLLGCIYDGWFMREAKDVDDDDDDDDAAAANAPTSSAHGLCYTILHMGTRRSRRTTSRKPSLVSHSASFPDGMRARTESKQLLTKGSTSSNVNASVNGESSDIDDHHSKALSSTLVSAVHLYGRGIRFKAAEEKSHNLETRMWSLATCIEFDDLSGTLTLPKLTVLHGTRRFLLAYEHTSRFSDACTLLSFVCFMDMLINTEHDVELLVECGVLVNELGSHKQLAAMWNRLTDRYPFRLSVHHQKLVKHIQVESQKRWRRWAHAFLDSHYERRPWLLLSAVFAMAIFIFTLLQTIYAMRGR